MHRGHEVFGTEITSKDTSISLQSDSKLPQSKCNTVALVKTDASTVEFRNSLAVTDNFICYTVRRTLLRVINTVSSEKCLLRGHTSIITDLKFSIAGHRKHLCSVDVGSENNNNDLSQPHIICIAVVSRLNLKRIYILCNRQNTFSEVDHTTNIQLTNIHTV